MQGEQWGPAAKALRTGDLAAAPISTAERLLLEFVGTVTHHAYKVTDDQVEALRAAGWRDDQIAEAVYDAALFNLFVRLADSFNIAPPKLYEPNGIPPAAAAYPNERR